MIHSLTLNGVKATIIFHDNLTWELVLEKSENCASICGVISMPSEPSRTFEPCDDEEDEEDEEDEDDEDEEDEDDEEDEEDEDSEEDEDEEDIRSSYIENLAERNKNDEERSKLMAKLFKEENLTFNFGFMNLYYDWEKTAPKMNRYQKMKAFIHANKKAFMDLEDDETKKRKTLMATVFKKRNLEFKDEYMDMYYEWQKTAPKLNRYKKICMFIEAHNF